LLVKRDTIGEAEQAFVVYRSRAAAPIAVGAPVVHETALTDTSGTGVTLPATATLRLAAGIVENHGSPLAANAWGRVQVAGPCSLARVQNDIAVAINPGDALVPVSAGSYLVRRTDSNDPAYFISLETIPASNPVVTQARRILIRGLR
jgi:hypothetical protein